jgi:hypothetical protein
MRFTRLHCSAQHTFDGSLNTIRLGAGVLVQNLHKKLGSVPVGCSRDWCKTYSEERINIFLLGLFLRFALVGLPRVPLVFAGEIHHTYRDLDSSVLMGGNNKDEETYQAWEC